MVTQFLNSDLVYAFAWMLVHSVWQLSLMAVILAIVTKMFSSISSNAKYIWGLATMGVSCLMALMTFSIYYLSPSGETMVFANITEELVPAITMQSPGAIQNFVSEYLAVIVNVWLMGSLLFLARFIGGYIYLKKLVRDAAFIPTPYQKKLYKLKTNFKIHREVLLKQTAQVTTPIVMGFVKPVILFPIGLVNQLSSSEVNAILAHELAHIKRHDFLVNLLQSLAEVVFYFHPGIWYISNNIRAERENCCDDLAIEHLGKKFSYAKTLVKLQELQHQYLQPALAMSGRHGQFSNRIKRLLNVPVQRSGFKEKFLVFVLMVFALFSFTDKHEPETKDLSDLDVYIIDDCPHQISDIKYYLDTIPERNSFHIKKRTEKNELELEMEEGNIKELIIDGQIILASDYHHYEDLVASLAPDASKEMITVFPDCGEDFGNIYFLNKNRQVFKVDSLLQEFDRRLKTFENYEADKFGFHIDKFDKVVMDSLLDAIHAKDWSKVVSDNHYKIDSIRDLLPNRLPNFSLLSHQEVE